MGIADKLDVMWEERRRREKGQIANQREGGIQIEGLILAGTFLRALQLLPHLVLQQPCEVGPSAITVQWMGKPVHREVPLLAHNYAPGQGQTWDMNPGILASEPVFLTPWYGFVLFCLFVCFFRLCKWVGDDGDYQSMETWEEQTLLGEIKSTVWWHKFWNTC